jgi:hypothetical protein
MDIVEEIKASRGNGSGRLLKEKLDATVKDERGLVIAPGVDEPYPVDSATKHEEAGQKN